MTSCDVKKWWRKSPGTMAMDARLWGCVSPPPPAVGCAQDGNTGPAAVLTSAVAVRIKRLKKKIWGVWSVSWHTVRALDRCLLLLCSLHMACFPQTRKAETVMSLRGGKN